MFISHLSLKNFRNYSSLELDLPNSLVVLHGENAQGKTNLLEAVYFLATTKSPKATADRELVNWNAAEDIIPFARLWAQVQRGRDTLKVEITLQCERAISEISPDSRERSQSPSPTQQIPKYVQKQIRINGLVRRATTLIGQLNIVMFGSQDIEMVAGPPSLRRRHLDGINSQIDHHYLRSFLRYNRVVSQRNHLLRLIQEGRGEKEELTFWNEELIKSGAYLVLQRHKMVMELRELAQVVHYNITGNRERLDLEYYTNAAESHESKDTLEAVKEEFRRALDARRDRDIAQGMSTVGPHRDDLKLLVNDIDMSTFSSRGQQRTIALSLKLAERELLLRKTGEEPVLLLDDVLSELDAQRRTHLLESAIGQKQALLTTTELDRIEPRFLAHATVLEVREGRVVAS